MLTRLGQCETPRDIKASNASLYITTVFDIMCDFIGKHSAVVTGILRSETSSLITSTATVMLLLLVQLKDIQKISRTTKAGLFGMVCLSVIVIAFAFVRVSQTKASNTHVNPVWLALWSQIEAFVGMSSLLGVIISHRKTPGGSSARPADCVLFPAVVVANLPTFKVFLVAQRRVRNSNGGSGSSRKPDLSNSSGRSGLSARDGGVGRAKVPKIFHDPDLELGPTGMTRFGGGGGGGGGFGGVNISSGDGEEWADRQIDDQSHAVISKSRTTESQECILERIPPHRVLVRSEIETTSMSLGTGTGKEGAVRG